MSASTAERPRKRLLLLLLVLLTAALVALGFGLALTQQSPTQAAGSTTTPTEKPADGELTTLAQTVDEEPEDETGEQGSAARTPSSADSTESGTDLPTLTPDVTDPVITVKPAPDSVGGENYFGKLGLVLFDEGDIDSVTINGVASDLADEPSVDVDGLVVGAYGIQSDVPFDVVAFDVAGNSATRTFVLDDIAPTVSWQVEPSPVEQGQSHWRWVVENAPGRGEVFDKRMLIDGLPFDTYVSTHFNRDLHFDSAVLSDGVHTAQGVIYDEAGNVGYTSIVTFRVDNTAPVLGWQNYPKAVESGSTNWLAVMIDGHLDPDTYFTWSYVVDGVSLFSDTRPNWGYNYSLDTTTLADGQHTVYAQACDQSGNCGVTNTVTFRIDNTGPTITVKPSPDSIGNGPTAYRELSLKLFDAGQIDYVVINGVKKELTNNNWSDVNDIEPGQFGIVESVDFVVTAYDVAGNSTSRTFRIDRTAPTLGWQNPPYEFERGSTNWLAVLVNGSGEPQPWVFTWSYVVDGVTLFSDTRPNMSYNYSFDTTTLADGTHTVYAQACDEAGNCGVTDTRTFTVDNSGPTITVKPAPDTVGDGPVGYQQLSLKLYDLNQVDYVVINGQKKELTNNKWSDVNYLNVGQFGITDSVDFTVVAYDVFGNSTTRTFRIDHTVPTVGWQVFREKPDAWGTTDWLWVITNEPAGTFDKRYYLVTDSGDQLIGQFVSGHFNYNYEVPISGFANGTYQVYGVAYDEAGNRSQTSPMSFTVLDGHLV